MARPVWQDLKARTIGAPIGLSGHEEGNLRPGPWTPSIRIPSTSAVLDGPVTQMTLGSTGRAAKAAVSRRRHLGATHGGDVHPRRERAEAPGRVAIRQDHGAGSPRWRPWRR